jgi:HPt (histidine-containing phosphotransfer) domain-containing protein
LSAPIDLEHLNRYVFGDKALLTEILGIFKEQAETLSSRLEPSMDDEAWSLAAHTLKGAARGVGAWALGAAAERAEKSFGEDERVKVLAEIVREARKASDHADALIADAA